MQVGRQTNAAVHCYHMHIFWCQVVVDCFVAVVREERENKNNCTHWLVFGPTSGNESHGRWVGAFPTTVLDGRVDLRGTPWSRQYADYTHSNTHILRSNNRWRCSMLSFKRNRSPVVCRTIYNLISTYSSRKKTKPTLVATERAWRPMTMTKRAPLWWFKVINFKVTQTATRFCVRTQARADSCRSN